MNMASWLRNSTRKRWRTWRSAGIIDIQTSYSDQDNHGEKLRDNSSVLDSSSDHLVEPVVPSIGSVGEQTGGEVPQPFGQVPPTMITPGSVSNTHNVGTITTTGLCRPAESLVSVQCSAHSTSWQPGCPVCDVALVHASEAPVTDPKMAVTDRLLWTYYQTSFSCCQVGGCWARGSLTHLPSAETNGS